jgi:transformation/transcription domain-associated protein
MRADLRTKGTLATEIRDNIESYCQGQQYSAFLNHLVPVFLKILDGAPVFISTSPEQANTKLRPRNPPSATHGTC